MERPQKAKPDGGWACFSCGEQGHLSKVRVRARARARVRVRVRVRVEVRVSPHPHPNPNLSEDCPTAKAAKAAKVAHQR